MWSIELPDGSEYEFSVDNGIAFRGVQGHRMAPMQNISTNYALADGALYQRTAVKPRVITFLLDAIGTSYETLNDILSALEACSNPHRGSLPVRIWYRGGAYGDRRYLDAYYETGLEGGLTNGFVSDSIPLRFLAVDPFWRYETPITGELLDIYDSMAVANRIIESDANGNWTNLDGGVDSTVWALAKAANGDIYIGGNFHDVGTVPVITALHVAYWDGAAWHALAVGADYGVDSGINALAFRQDGGLYLGGTFTQATDATAMLKIGLWNAGAWSAVGAGLDDEVADIAVDKNGDVYVGGAFDQVAGGGIAVKYIAMWDISATSWVAVGAAGGLDGIVNTLAIAPNGDVYAGGQFHDIFGGAAALMHIAMWDVSAAAWVALGTGLDDIVRDIVIASNGDIYATGYFLNAGGNPANYIAKWNGASWSALGSGLNNYGTRLEFGPNGMLYVSGFFTTAGGRSTPMRWAAWNNGGWLPGWVGATGNIVEEFSIEADRSVLAGAFTTATVPGVTHIDNVGSARAYPIITITGPGQLLYLINYTTGQVIYFDITLTASEVLTISFSGQKKTIISSFRGDMYPGIIGGTLTNWYLQPGDNYIGCYVDNAAATATYGYMPTYWSSN